MGLWLFPLLDRPLWAWRAHLWAYWGLGPPQGQAPKLQPCGYWEEGTEAWGPPAGSQNLLRFPRASCQVTCPLWSCHPPSTTTTPSPVATSSPMPTRSARRTGEAICWAAVVDRGRVREGKVGGHSSPSPPPRLGSHRGFPQIATVAGCQPPAACEHVPAAVGRGRHLCAEVSGQWLAGAHAESDQWRVTAAGREVLRQHVPGVLHAGAAAVQLRAAPTLTCSVRLPCVPRGGSPAGLERFPATHLWARYGPARLPGGVGRHGPKLTAGCTRRQLDVSTLPTAPGAGAYPLYLLCAGHRLLLPGGCGWAPAPDAGGHGRHPDRHHWPQRLRVPALHL